MQACAVPAKTQKQATQFLVNTAAFLGSKVYPHFNFTFMSPGIPNVIVIYISKNLLKRGERSDAHLTHVCRLSF